MSPQPPLTDDETRRRIASVAHWYHQIEVRPGITTPGVNRSAATLELLELPERCDGLRVLDVGARDGFFAFELERRGADVVAIDYMDPGQTGFPVAKDLLGSKVEYVVDNVYNLSPERYGTFDIILFLGVLYHLRDPLLALDRLWDMARERAQIAVETQLLDNAVLLPDGGFERLAGLDERLAETCLMQFYPEATLGGDPTNYWSPNAAAMRALLRTAGWRPTHEVVQGGRGIFQAERIVDRQTGFQRRLEKTTLTQAHEERAAAAAASGDADSSADDIAQLQAEVGRVRQLQFAADQELGGARRHIAALEAELQRKESELVDAVSRLRGASALPEPAVAAAAPTAWLTGRVARIASALRRRPR